MGGPCFLLVDTEAAEPVPHAKRDASFTPASSLPGRPRRRVPAPSCTDNFQVAPFSFDGALWQSVEQCFQAYKFNDVEARERIRAIVKQPGEHDHSHGMRVWMAGGRSNRAKLRSDWDAVKVEIMLRATRAKLAAHQGLRDELLSTGDAEIVGAPSTDWQGVTGSHNWSSWNGRIQMLCREELRQQAAPERGESEAHASLRHAFAAYMAAEGGCQYALPGEAAQATTAEDEVRQLKEELRELKEEIMRHHQLIVNNWVGNPVPSLGSEYSELWSDPERFDPCCVLSMRTAAELIVAFRARVAALDAKL